MAVIAQQQTIKPGYKQTEVGVIPEDWEVSKFSELFDFANGVNADKNSYGKGVKFINVLEVINHPHIRSSDVQGLVRLDTPTQDSYSVRRGDILFNRTSETQEEVGLTSVYDDDAHVVFGGFVIRGRPKTTRFDVEYSGYAFRSAAVRRQIIARGQGAIRANIGQADLKQVWVVVPKISEQCAIAAALSDADALIASLDKLIVKKRDLKQAAMQQLLTGKKRLPGFSEKWEVKKVKELGEIVTGSTPSTRIKEYWNGDIPWVTPTDISDKKDIYVSEREITALGLASIRKVPSNSVLVTCIASIGKNAVLRNDGACNQQINAIIPNKENDADFLYYLIESKKQYLVGNAGITATSIISKRDFSQLDFTVPLKAEQTAIAAVLSDMDADIAALEARRDKARDIKQGMMQELLTGKTRLL